MSKDKMTDLKWAEQYAPDALDMLFSEDRKLRLEGAYAQDCYEAEGESYQYAREYANEHRAAAMQELTDGKR